MNQTHDAADGPDAAGPDVAVPDATGPGAGAVVVGVDGSEGARTALATAMREAVLRGAPLLAVTSYEPPDRWAPEAAGLIDEELIRRELLTEAETAVSGAAGEIAARGLTAPHARVVVAPGGAAEVLCRLSHGAVLLVVGHRGRGALATRLIGSVGLGVVVHATCPVLVVRPTPREVPA